jgi:hypothetical protein
MAAAFSGAVVVALWLHLQRSSHNQATRSGSSEPVHVT